MKKTRFLALALCTLLLVSGCGDLTSKKTSSNIEISGVNEFPITKEPVTLSIFTPQSMYIENFETNEFTKEYEEKTGVHIEWHVATGDQRQAANLMLASGDYADIFMDYIITKSEQLGFAEQGVFIDISDYIDEHGYYIKKMFDEKPEYRKLTAIGDAIYGLPQVIESYRDVYKNMMWVYEPWLEKLNLDMPETTDDFYNLLKAFKEQDPNGNGKADEIPLAALGVKHWQGIEPYLMSAFLPVGSERYYVENGEVKYAAVQPEYREGLRFIKKLYDEGLLYSDSFIMDRTQMMSIGENETVILGCGPGQTPQTFSISNGQGKRFPEYCAIPPLKGPKGVQATVKEPPLFYTHFSVTSACEHPEVAIKWVDWFYSEEGYRKTQGSSNYITREAKEGELGVDGKQALWTMEKIAQSNTTSTGIAQNKNWQNFGVFYRKWDQIVKLCSPSNSKIDPKGNLWEAYETYSKYEVDNFLGDMAVSSKDLDAYTDFRTAMDEVEISFAAFVTGELDIDKDWDDYVKRVNDMGLAKYTKILQKVYDETNK